MVSGCACRLCLFAFRERCTDTVCTGPLHQFDLVSPPSNARSAASESALLAALWVLESAHCAWRSPATVCLGSYLKHLAAFSPQVCTSYKASAAGGLECLLPVACRLLLPAVAAACWYAPAHGS
jgi:hypothetical protein